MGLFASLLPLRRGAALLGLAVALSGCAELARLGAHGQACGAFDAQNRVIVSFGVGRAREVRAHVPRLGPDPWLEADVPVQVVVFAGPMRDIEIIGRPAVHGRGPESNIQNLCVTRADGPVRLFPNVDLTGLSP